MQNRAASSNSPQHAYARVASALRNAYRPGAQLPSLDQLAESYEVSKPTLRRAIGELTDEGLVSVVHGVGTFYADKRPEPSADSRSELQDIAAQLGELKRRVAALARDERK